VYTFPSAFFGVSVSNILRSFDELQSAHRVVRPTNARIPKLPPIALSTIVKRLRIHTRERYRYYLMARAIFVAIKLIKRFIGATVYERDVNGRAGVIFYLHGLSPE